MFKYVYKAVVLLVVIGLFVALICCLIAEKEEKRAIAAKMEASHELRRMFPEEKTVKSDSFEFSGGFFLVAGAVQGHGEKKEVKINTIKFAWKNSSGEYIITEMPEEKCRIAFKEGVRPSVRFKLNSVNLRTFETDIASFIAKCVNYVVITCRDEDWPQNVKLPLS